MTDEWRFPNRATPLGSSAYYSVRFGPKPLRDDLAALLAWRHQIYAIADDVSDTGVARLKLQWWRDELARTFDRKPQHPLSKALQPALERHAPPQTLFADIADRVEAEVLRQQPTNESDLRAACERDLGALFELVARYHGINDSALLLAARDLGAFCAQVYLIRDSGALARRGRAVFSVEQLQTHGLSTEALCRRENRSRLPELLASAATRARARLGTLLARREMPFCIRARTLILETLLEEIEREGFDLADQRIELTPLRKLWLAWRESRRG